VDEDDQYFLVMELVDGIDLGSWARALKLMGRQTPWHIVTAAALEVLRALSAAHRRVDANGAPAPVFHRDVTPHNVLLSIDGVIKLGDFGLARAMDRARTTRPDVVKGKVSYLAPEVAHGDAATARSDLYALAIVIWETLAGRRLFDAKTDAEVIRLVRNPEVPPLLRYRPDVPVALHAALIRALERDPEKRFATADEMRAVLAKVLTARGQPTDHLVISESVRETRARLSAPMSSKAPPPPPPEAMRKTSVRPPPLPTRSAQPPPPPPMSAKPPPLPSRRPTVESGVVAKADVMPAAAGAAGGAGVKR
jgi:serine/threonine-protein kinase